MRGSPTCAKYEVGAQLLPSPLLILANLAAIHRLYLKARTTFSIPARMRAGVDGASEVGESSLLIGNFVTVPGAAGAHDLVSVSGECSHSGTR